MRSYRALVALALFFCLYTVAAAPTQVPQLARRQDDSPSQSSQPPSSTPDRSSRRPSPTPTLQSSSASLSDQPSPTPKPSSSTSLVPSESAADKAPTTTATNGPASTSDPTGSPKPQLPLKPRITPALGLSGIIFLLSGLVYALIGIKNQWLYIFGSAAYLSSLAVTVLIVYLMNPPVTDAVQGAFFVAAAITGLIFGALALVFADITDGLGCLLGGFCLSMWLLSLKAGGLIDSTSGRAIFIASMSAAGYAFSWSHYTRNYGLIGSISFAGATISMLGVDCFSGAGWKEFWLYLWNLNPDTFPLNTNTYPLTKGMKAELAGVVILTVLGIISQLRLWKLIKEHRDQTSAQRIEKEQAQEREEEERGRKLEDNFQKERAAWEAAYGDGTSTDRGVDSCVSTIKTGRGSVASVSVEPLPLPKTGNVVSAGPAQDDVDAIAPIRSNQKSSSNPRLSSSPSFRQSSDTVAVDGLSRNISVKSLQPSAPPPPVVVPLPFKIPQEEDEASQASDNASVSAVPDVEEEPFEGRKSLPRPVSSTSAMKRISRDTTPPLEFEGPIVVPHVEDDRASSIAATLDEADRISLPDLSPPHSPVKSKFNADKLELSGEMTGTESTDRKVDSVDPEKAGNLEGAPSPTTSIPLQSLTSSTDPKPESPQEPRRRSDTLVESVDKNQKSKSATSPNASSSSQTEQSQSVTGSLSGALSSRLSKVAQSYRTNEWAKHLESADTPDVDEIQAPDSPGVAVHHERPAPVSEEITLPVPAVQRHSSRMSIDEPVYQNGVFLRTNSSVSRKSQTDLRPLSRSPSFLASGKISRTPSAVNLPTVAEPSSKRISSGPSAVPDNTLLGQREALMRKRASSQSFNLQSASTTSLIKGGDEMTLAARKRALQNKQQRPPSASKKWQNKGWASPPPDFDSHQPKRTNTAQSDQKREVLLADWRESMRQIGTPVASAAMMAEEQQRAALDAKRQMEMERQHQAMVAQQRDSMRQSMMRTHDMQDAHREAMRKLQAEANKRA